MVKLNVSQKGITIKTSWSEVTTEELHSIGKESPRAVILALSTLTASEVSSLHTDQVLALYELVSFVDDLDDLALSLPASADLPDVDVAAASYELAEVARLRLQQHKKPYLLFPALTAVYFKDRKFTAVETMATGALLYQDLAKLFDRFKDLASEPPNDDQLEAGVEALHTFGTYGIVESLASRYNCKPYDVYGWAAEEVFLDLLYQQTKARYQDNLRNIESRKNGPQK